MDIVDAKKECMGFDQQIKREVNRECQKFCHDTIAREAGRTKNIIEDKVKDLRLDFMEKVAKQIRTYCDERLHIPDLVGAHCPFSSLSNFLM